MKKNKFIIILATFAFSSSAFSDSNIKNEEYSFSSIGLNATRLIDKGKPLSLLISNPNNYPFLIESSVLKDDTVTPASFIITPPLFRLDANQKSDIKINRINNDYPNDRESLSWLCAAGIPPENDSAWSSSKTQKSNSAGMQVQVKIKRCIKIFTRPDGLKSSSEEAMAGLIWSQNAGSLQVKNMSPFYVTLASVEVNNKKVNISENNLIDPYGSMSYSNNNTGLVNWSAYTDIGGESKKYAYDMLK